MTGKINIRTGARAERRPGVPGALRLAALLFACALAAGCSRPTAMATEPAATSPRASFPLQVVAGQRHLVDSRGRPFMIRGDAAWCLMTQLKREDVDLYLEDRARKGFNAVLVQLMEPSLCAHAPLNPYGEAPFTSPGDLTRPNEAYFEHAEYVIGKAEGLGMLVLMAPAYLGYDGGAEGWYRQMQEMGTVRLREFGRYVARRFGSHDNLLWVQGGDFNPPEKDLARAVAEGVRDVAPQALQTFHGSRRSTALGYLGPQESWLNVNNIYTDEATVVEYAATEYRRSTMPFFLIEARYENERGTDEQVVRMQAYQSVLSGATGHVMGNRPVWGFFDGWRAALQSGGARSMAVMHRLFDGLPWWLLQPDLDGRFLTTGAGSGRRAAAAVARDGSYAVVYSPSLRFLSCDLSQLQGQAVSARWYDPTNGTLSPVPGSPFEPRGARVFTPPGPNAGGFEDWVLLLKSGE